MEEKKNTDDVVEVINEYTEKAVKNARTAAKSLRDKLMDEKEKAEIRSEIGHNKRDLAKIYEQLGRQYYAYKVTDAGIENENDTFDRIRSKEKLIELLNEKLEKL